MTDVGMREAKTQLSRLEELWRRLVHGDSNGHVSNPET